MKMYKVFWDRNDYGSIIIEANSEEEAKEKFSSGDFLEEDLNIKDGGFEISTIEEI